MRPDFVNGVNAPAVSTKMMQDFAKPTKTFWKARKTKALWDQPKLNETSESTRNVTKFSLAIRWEVCAPEESITKGISGKY